MKNELFRRYLHAMLLVFEKTWRRNPTPIPLPTYIATTRVEVNQVNPELVKYREFADAFVDSILDKPAGNIDGQ